MTDRLLTDDDLSAIRAMVEYHRDIVYLDYWYNVDDVSKSPSSPAVKDNTLARLLAHIDAQDAEIDLMKRKTDRYVEESMTILVEAEAEWKAKHDAQDTANARLRDALANVANELTELAYRAENEPGFDIDINELDTMRAAAARALLEGASDGC